MVDLVSVRIASAMAKRAGARLRSQLGSRALGFRSPLPPGYDGFLYRVSQFKRFITGYVLDPGVDVAARKAVQVDDRDNYIGNVYFNSGVNALPHYRASSTRDALAGSGESTGGAAVSVASTTSFSLGAPPPADPTSYDAHSYDIMQPTFGEVAAVHASVLVTPELLRPANARAAAIREANQELGVNDPVYRTTAPYEYEAWWVFDLLDARGVTVRATISEEWVTARHPGYTVLKTADAYGPPTPVGSVNATVKGDVVYFVLSATKEHAPMDIPPSDSGEYTGAHNHYDSGTSALVVVAYDTSIPAVTPGGDPDPDAPVLWTQIYELRTESDSRLVPFLCDDTNTRPWLQDFSPLKWSIEAECFAKSRGYRPNDFTRIDVVPTDTGVKVLTIAAIVVPSVLYWNLAHPDINNMVGSYYSTSVLKLDVTGSGVSRTFVAGDFVMSEGDYDAAVVDLTSAATEASDMPSPAPYAALWASFSAAVARQAYAPDTYGDDYKRSYTGARFVDETGDKALVLSNNVGLTVLHSGTTTGPMGHHYPSRPVQAFLPTREAPYLIPLNYPQYWPGGSGLDAGNSAYALDQQSSGWWEVYDLSGTPSVTSAVDTDNDLYFVARAYDGRWHRNYFGSMVPMPEDYTVVVPGRVVAFCGVSQAAGVERQVMVVWDLVANAKRHVLLPATLAEFPLQWLHCYSHATVDTAAPVAEQVNEDAALLYCVYSETVDIASATLGNLPGVPGATKVPGDDVEIWATTDSGSSWRRVLSGSPIGSPSVVGKILWKRKVGDFAKPESALDYSLE